MLDWIFDASARSACRAYGAIAGRLPAPCLTNAGRPFLVLLAGLAAILLVLFLVVRASRAGSRGP